MALYYPAIIERASEGCGVFLPDLPGCTSAGMTIRDAVLNGEEALRAHIDIAAEHGDTVPSPTELYAVEIDQEVAEILRILLPTIPH